MTKAARNQFIFKHPSSGIELWFKRLDEQFPNSLGNKAYKLKYNFQEAKKEGHHKILTFGGAYSNHIAAVAQEAHLKGFESIGIIRGEELARDVNATLSENPTLRKAVDNGMHLHFVCRQDYREKNMPTFKRKLQNKFGNFYYLPEGGSNVLAVKGCKEIVHPDDNYFDIIACPVGTGGTLSGIIESSFSHQQVWGFSALNADLEAEIRKFTSKTNWKLEKETYFGGFAKINKTLISFINSFTSQYQVLLDPIYTAKMIFGLMDKIEKGNLAPNQKILAIHTGGLQSIPGMNRRLKKKNLPLINDY